VGEDYEIRACVACRHSAAAHCVVVPGHAFGMRLKIRKCVPSMGPNRRDISSADALRRLRREASMVDADGESAARH
jgi:hypothetical protein